MGRAADTGLALLWEQRIRRQQRGRLSIGEFCRQEGVSPASFYAWRRRLPGAGSSETCSPLFVPVDLPTPVMASGGVRIELPGGMVLILPAEASPELLTAAIRAVLAATSGQERAAC
jgi:hypothetical protein